MYSYLVRYFAIACHITLGLGKINETFKEYHNSNMVKCIDDKYTTAHLEENYEDSFFSVMSMDDRVKYCNEAKDFAGLDAITPITDTQLKFLGAHFEAVILECKTLPISYLWKENSSKNQIYIMMWSNEFFNYHYEVQITNSEPILYSKSMRSGETENKEIEVADLLKVFRSFDDDGFKGVYVSENVTAADLLDIIGSYAFADQRIKNNPFSQLEKDDHIKICLAAKRHLRLLAGKDNDAQIVPVMQSDRAELAQIFDFGNEIGDHVALRCPSITSMYIYFKDPTMPYSKDLQIVLVQN